jgi:hypothetical protein
MSASSARIQTLGPRSGSPRLVAMKPTHDSGGVYQRGSRPVLIAVSCGQWNADHCELLVHPNEQTPFDESRQQCIGPCRVVR